MIIAFSVYASFLINSSLLCFGRLFSALEVDPTTTNISYIHSLHFISSPPQRTAPPTYQRSARTSIKLLTADTSFDLSRRFVRPFTTIIFQDVAVTDTTGLFFRTLHAKPRPRPHGPRLQHIKSPACAHFDYPVGVTSCTRTTYKLTDLLIDCQIGPTTRGSFTSSRSETGVTDEVRAPLTSNSEI